VTDAMAKKRGSSGGIVTSAPRQCLKERPRLIADFLRGVLEIALLSCQKPPLVISCHALNAPRLEHPEGCVRVTRTVDQVADAQNRI
jgi:hypothetical protein